MTALLALLSSPAPGMAAGPEPVDLGSAGDFVILSESGISDVSPSAIVGDIGTSPIAGTAITATDGNICNEVVGTIYTVGPSGPACRVADATLLTMAVGDMVTAYNDAAGRTLPDATELGAGNINGLTITPGLYKWSSSVLIPTVVTLNGGPNDVWIFQIAGDLIVGTGAQVVLAGGAQAKNIFWQVAGETLLDTTANFKGIILCQTLIAMNTGATLEGRALAQTAVTLQQNAIGIIETKTECTAFLKAEKTVFDAGQKADKLAFTVAQAADKLAFDAGQKADKLAFQLTHPTAAQLKAFTVAQAAVKHDFTAAQAAEKLAFTVAQAADKLAFAAEQKIDMQECSTLQ
jgi:hypothetical protein